MTDIKTDLIDRQIERALTLLKGYAGFFPTSSLRHKLTKLFSNINDETLDLWLEELEKNKDSGALNALVEDLTNHETYFFREKVQLDVLLDSVFPQLIQRKKESGNHHVRLWSAACSTGEEPYTLAMVALKAFLDAGIAKEIKPGKIFLPPPWSLEILATDISRQALKIASNGIYVKKEAGLHSFRQFPADFIRFFDLVPDAESNPTEKIYRVNDDIRKWVSFEWFNLKNNIPPVSNVDVIFCRNVLIYIDTKDHGDVQNMLGQALHVKGSLFLGLVDSLSKSVNLKSNHLNACAIYEKA